MPISSNARVSAASLYRLGGCVVWLFGSNEVHRRVSPTETAGSTASRSARSASGIVRSFDVRPQIAGKLDRLADGLEHRPVDLDGDRDAVSAGVAHLAGDRPFPNQVVELELVGAEPSAQRFGEIEVVAGRPNRLVRLLRVLHLRLIQARRRRQILVAVLRSDQTPGGFDRQPGQASSSRFACK